MEAVISSAVGALASNVVSGLFSKSDKPAAAPAPAPVVETPTLMPDPMAQKATARRKAAMSLSRQLNSADTLLAGGDTKLGA